MRLFRVVSCRHLIVHVFSLALCCRSQSRMFSVQSVRGKLFGFWGRSKKAKPLSIQKTSVKSSLNNVTQEKMHLFFSGMKAAIDRNEYKRDAPPSLFCSFVSTPAEACQRAVSKWSILKVLSLKKMAHLDFPRSKKQKRTFAPSWPDEVHFEVSPHRSDGSAIDLTGALLHVQVLDGSNRGEPRWVGTVCLNLAELIQQSRKIELKARQEAAERQPRLPRLPPPPAPISSPPPIASPSSFVQTVRTLCTRSGHPSPSQTGQAASTASVSERPSSPSFGVMTSGPSDSLRASYNSNVFSSNARKKVRTSLRRKSIQADELMDLSLSRHESQHKKLPHQSESPVAVAKQHSNLSIHQSDDDDDNNEDSDNFIFEPRLHHSEGDARTTSQKRPSFAGRFGLGRKARSSSDLSLGGGSGAGGDALNNLNIHSITLDEPLLKNGKQVGRISFGIDCWWLREGEGRASSFLLYGGGAPTISTDSATTTTTPSSSGRLAIGIRK
jgi:hypothetical protein